MCRKALTYFQCNTEGKMHNLIMSTKHIFIQSFENNLIKHHFLRIMSLGTGPKMTHCSCLIFEVISLSDDISSIGPKISDAFTYIKEIYISLT